MSEIRVERVNCTRFADYYHAVGFENISGYVSKRGPAKSVHATMGLPLSPVQARAFAAAIIAVADAVEREGKG